MATSKKVVSERTAKSTGAAERGQHVAAAQDAGRRNDEGTALSLEERMALIRNEFEQEALPKAPPIPGYHVCWLTTNSTYDPIQRRLRLGYELVRRDEVAGFEHLKTNSAEYADYVMCNEMILAKLPEPIYQMIMQEFHHDKPLREEEAINTRIQELTQSQDSAGTELVQREEGFEEQALVKRRPTPVFAGS